MSLEQDDIGFAPWRVRPHYKISISSSPPPLSPPTFRVRPKLLC